MIEILAQVVKSVILLFLASGLMAGAGLAVLLLIYLLVRDKRK